MTRCNTAVNPVLAPWAFKQLYPLTLKVAGLHSHPHTNIPSYLRGPIKGHIENSWAFLSLPLCDLSVTAILLGPFRRSGSSFCLRGGPKQCISGPFLRQGLLFQGVERAGAGLTSVCVQSQAGPEHSVPRWPPSPLPGGLCSRFHAIRAAACFPAQSCQGHKRPWVGSHQEGWAWKIGKMYHKAHPLDGCLAPCGGVSRPSSPFCTFLFPFPLAELHLSPSPQRTSTSFRWNGANKLKGGAPNESMFFVCEEGFVPH